MKKQPLVSIIVPTYNSAVYLREAIDSALAQTYRGVEIIVIDDGSTDNTKKILGPYIIDKKIKYIYQANRGLSGARNTGIKVARGEFIALLDADDIFLPNKIERQVLHMINNPTCDMSYCDLYHFWDDRPNELLKLNYKYYSGRDVFPNLLRKSFIAPVTVVFRKKVFEKYGYFNEEIRQYAEDFDFWLRLSYRGANICFLRETLAKLRLRREGNIQGLSNQPKMKLTALKVIENLYREMSVDDRLRYNMKFYLMRRRLKTAFAYIMTGDKSEAGCFISEAFRDYHLGGTAAVLVKIPIFLVPSIIIKKVAQWLYYVRRDAMLEPVKK